MKAFTLTILVIAVLSFFFLQPAFSLDASLKSQGEKFTRSSLIKQKQKYWMDKREKDYQLAPIKNQLELEKYLEITPTEKSPLNALSEIEREIFINSLTFTSRGIAGFDYSVLSYGPTATEVYNILALFGFQSNTPYLPNLTVASESDSSIMAVAKIMQGDFVLLDSLCIWNTDIKQFFCGQHGLEICFPMICL
ncbi:hypothetical protein [Microbulbifer sp. JMSA008]|uniref:hypothetical protein n=1 Tax=Microbulbifer sp. JMSA008 TaxID=3243373 RepID=UPI00403A36D5